MHSSVMKILSEFQFSSFSPSNIIEFVNIFCSLMFYHQHETCGVDVDEMKKPATIVIFHAWIEDLEKDAVVKTDCVLEARLLEKYTNLVFYNPDTKKTCSVYAGNLEFYYGYKKRGINKGWELIAVAEDGEDVSW